MIQSQSKMVTFKQESIDIANSDNLAVDFEELKFRKQLNQLLTASSLLGNI